MSSTKNLDSDSTLQRLNREYTKCVTEEVQKRWDSSTPSTALSEEYCVKEKDAFYLHLKVNFPNEFLNIKKLEAYNFE